MGQWTAVNTVPPLAFAEEASLGERTIQGRL